MGKNRASASSKPWCRGRLQRDSFSNVRDESRTITVRILVARERFLNKDLKTQFIKLKDRILCQPKFTIEFRNPRHAYFIQPGLYWGFPGGSVGKESTCSAGDPGLIPGSGRTPGEGNGNLLQYSCLGNPADRGTWSPTVHGVAKSWTRLSN